MSLLAHGDNVDMVKNLLLYGGVDINRRDKASSHMLVG
ncbi:hypothetical protein EON64_01260 [archaeon]|nr:MAG: hypothetical protein EON64_01260 [archaeon]